MAEESREKSSRGPCECLRELSSSVSDFWAPHRVARIRRPITALEFLREYVQSNVPVVFERGAGLLDQWQ